MSGTTRALAEAAKVLPPRWRAEIWADRVALTNDRGESVTLDLERRTFRWGLTLAGERATTAQFTGRGWRARLIAAAIEALRGLAR